MSDAIINPEPAQDAVPAVKKSLDSSFKRNMLFIGIAALVAVAVISVSLWSAFSKPGANAMAVAPMNIPTNVAGVSNSGKPTDMTPADQDRLNRVQTAESEAAKLAKNTYIPKELPLNSESLKPPAVQSSGPGRGYAYSTGDASAHSAVDAQRDARINQGIQLQLAAIVARWEAPPTQSAPAYAGAGSGAATASTAPAVPASASATSADELVKGLTIAGARLVSPLDTAKTEFISAEITSGPLAGAYLVGKGRMVGEEGVQVSYTRMKFNDVTYAVNVTGLDNQTSSDALAAQIDRKLLARYVMPVAFSTAQAYLLAVARPAQSVVATSGLSTTIVTPGATAREAAAAGLAAGIGKAGESIGQAKPSAYMPIDTSIALLFNDPVLKKAIK